MPKLVILTSPSGGGKSTLAKKIETECIGQGKYGVYVLSTDDYWLRPDGHYSFEARLLEQAHQWTFNKFRQIVEDPKKALGTVDVVILDNTNLRFAEFERYVLLAVENGWEVDIQRVTNSWVTDVDELFHRNTHSVPKQTIERQLARWENEAHMQSKLEKLLGA